jgi:hypothetical protein
MCELGAFVKATQESLESIDWAHDCRAFSFPFKRLLSPHLTLLSHSRPVQLPLAATRRRTNSSSFASRVAVLGVARPLFCRQLSPILTSRSSSASASRLSVGVPPRCFASHCCRSASLSPFSRFPARRLRLGVSTAASTVLRGTTSEAYEMCIPSSSGRNLFPRPLRPFAFRRLHSLFTISQRLLGDDETLGNSNDASVALRTSSPGRWAERVRCRRPATSVRFQLLKEETPCRPILVLLCPSDVRVGALESISSSFILLRATFPGSEHTAGFSFYLYRPCQHLSSLPLSRSTPPTLSVSRWTATGMH